jgi:hypothetical protein
MMASLACSRVTLVAIALFAAACNSRRAPPGPAPSAAVTVVVQPSATQDAPALTVAPPERRDILPAPPPDCALSLREVELSECNPRPKQRDYPECWRYLIEPVSEPDAGSGCLPGHVTVTITGWPARIDVVRARVDHDASRPREVKLILESVEMGLIPREMGSHQKPGALVGTLLFEHGVVSELRFGPAMPSQIHSASLRADPPR